MRALKIIAVTLLIVIIAIGVMYQYYLGTDLVAEPRLEGALTGHTLAHGGKERSYRLYTPKEVAADPPVIFVLHGSDGDGDRIRALTAYEFDKIADTHGALVVYPDGYERHWNDCRAAGPYAANEENIDDVGFLLAIAEKHGSPHGTPKLFATGLSNGGHMAYRLALEVPEAMTGIAAIAANLPAESNMDCTEQPGSTAVLVMNGTADPVNPYAGGTVSLFGTGNRGMVLSTEATTEFWAKKAGQDTTIAVHYDDTVDDGTRAAEIAWKDPGKPPVANLTLIGGGHTIPHPDQRMPRLLGPTAHDINGPEEIWKFFEEAMAARGD
jgi:polyhydroxybutyrate depolymerase